MHDTMKTEKTYDNIIIYYKTYKMKYIIYYVLIFKLKNNMWYNMKTCWETNTWKKVNPLKKHTDNT